MKEGSAFDFQDDFGKETGKVIGDALPEFIDAFENYGYFPVKACICQSLLIKEVFFPL